jgi:hypothetical protein
MDFEEALKFLRAFSACNPKIYKEFAGFPEENTREAEDGYVLFVDPCNSKNDLFCKLKDFAETNNLDITTYREVFMVSGSNKKL